MLKNLWKLYIKKTWKTNFFFKKKLLEISNPSIILTVKIPLEISKHTYKTSERVTFKGSWFILWRVSLRNYSQSRLFISF